MTVLRVGCIMDKGPQPQHARELIELAQSSPHYSVCLLVIREPATIGDERRNGDAAGAGRDGVANALERWVFRVIGKLERLLVGRLPGVPESFRTCRREGLAISTLRVQAPGPDRGTSLRYDPDDVSRLREHELDVLICCAGGGTPGGEIVAGARLGLLSLRYGDPAAPHGGPPGFWEVYHRNPSSRFRIERVTARGDGAAVLCEGGIYTSPFHTLNSVRLLRKSAVFAHRLLERVAKEGSFPTAARRASPSPSRPQVPPLKVQLAYVARTAVHFLERASRRMVGFRWRWSVAYQFTDNWREADLPKSRVIENPRGRYFADPCVVRRDGRSVCFVEDYHCRSSSARITALGLDPEGYEELGVALSESFHLSYPFVFEAGGELYMCPETEEARDIRLYRCTRFPLEWSLHRILIRGVAAVDTSIAFHDGRWWLLTNIDSADMGDYRSELHLFHAETFDSERWQPHPENPVVLDSDRARNGGLFQVEGTLYRVFQVHGFDVYGQSMGVARITEMSTEHYSEEVVARIAPDFFPGIDGTHAMSYDGSVLALDFVRRQRCSR